MTPQELKNSILQLAIQGKLVEQRAEEGTAEELYQKIQKNHNGLKPCKDELDFSAMDFEIPETWKMMELNQLYHFVDYRGKTPIKLPEGIFLITASNIKQGYMDYTRKEYISPEEYNTRKSRGITQKGDLLFTTEAPMGNAATCDLEECSCGQRIITFQEYEKNTAIPELFMYFILSPQFQKQLLNNCTGTTAKGIKADKLKHLIIPLPPLAEQKRIVAKIEELLPYIDCYEQAWSKLEKFNSRFPEDMKKSLLQYAIQGKLVEQRAEEGTAEELFAKIQEERQRLIAEKKIKKEKPLPEITDDEKPFDIPENWKWVRLGTLVQFENGDRSSKYPVETDYVDFGVPFFGAKDMGEKYMSFDNVRYISEHKFNELGNGKLHDQDFICLLRGSVGKIAIFEKDSKHKTGFICAQMVIMRCIDLDMVQYLYYIMKSMHYTKSVDSKTTGTAVRQLPAKELANVLIPLPPLAEQKRIVKKLEQLLPLCERLK